jgi:hypothetical protein
MKTLEKFFESKRQLSGFYGFDPTWIPSNAFGFQEALIEWACRKGRASIFADCGLGKTMMQLTWAHNVAKHSGKRVLILTPLAVSHQTEAEARKFGIDCSRSSDGSVDAQIVVTNYERLHYFNADDFTGLVCDESSILKNFDGVIKDSVTEFARTLKYRLLCTATAAPNDFIELGTSSEALGELGFMDMLNRFFKKEQATTSRSDEFRSGTYRLRSHAKRDFWRWVCSWARAVRKPSDLGFSDEGYALPELITRQHTVTAKHRNPEYLFDLPAFGLAEQRQERSRTLTERCEMAAQLIESRKGSSVAWCHLNAEGDLLTKLIRDCAQVSGDDTDEEKEEAFKAFETGQVKAIVTKPKIAGFGLNWQHCHHQTFFPSHSFEQWYQAIRRCWRFGQKNPVTVDVIASEGEMDVLRNLQRKAKAADEMFAMLVSLMRDELKIQSEETHKQKEELPTWLSIKA